MAALATPRVLVVDDNREAAEAVGYHLAAQGLDVRVAHAADEAEAEFLRSPPDALVTDLLLPDRTGQKLVAQLARKATLPPVFVMTGVFRGAAGRAQLGPQVPVAGWFEKPFDHRALAAAVCRAVGHPYRRISRGIQAEPRTGDTGPILTDRTATIVGGEAHTHVLRSTVSAVRSQVRSVFGGDPFRDAQTGFGRSTTPSATDMSEGLRRELRMGDLRSVSVPRLLGAFHLAGETAEVAFEAEDRRQIVYFERGRPVFAVSDRPGDRLSAFITERLALSPAGVQQAVREAKACGRPVTTLMVDRGWLDEAQLVSLTRAHTRKLVLDLFRWTDGQYVIRFGRRSDLPGVTLDGSVGSLVIEGVRDGIPLSRLKELLPEDIRPMPSPNPPFAWFSLPIRDPEAALLLRVTGARTVRALIDEWVPMLAEQQVRAVLYGLLSLGVLVSGRPGASAGALCAGGGGA